jgi:hypothetical protein
MLNFAGVAIRRPLLVGKRLPQPMTMPPRSSHSIACTASGSSPLATSLRAQSM